MKKLEKLCNGDKMMKVTQLIGLDETKRKIYEHLESHGIIRGNLKKAYEYHQKELELLIKYQSRMRK